MANYYYGQDILIDTLFRAGEQQVLTAGSSASDYLSAAKRYIMRAYYDTIVEYPWPGSLSSPPSIINTVDKVTGTATYTKGSDAVTLGAVVATSLAGRKFYIDNDGVQYRIAAHTGGTDAVTLDATYKEGSGTSAFTVYQDEYSLASDCLTIHRALDRSRPDSGIDIISKNMMDDLTTTGIGAEGSSVSRMAIIEGGKVKISPWTSEATTLEVVYVKRPPALTWDATANDIPSFIDEEHRHLLSDYATGMILKDKDQEWESSFKLYSDELARMKFKHAQAQRPRNYPKPGQGIWR